VHFLELTDTTAHLFNDMVVLPDGNIFITDTEYGAIYNISPPYRQLHLYCKNSWLSLANGIASDGRYLFVATGGHAIVRVRLADHLVLTLANIKDTAKANEMDAMVMIKDRIFTVANGRHQKTQISIMEYRLDPDHQRVIDEKVIDSGNAEFQIPTGITYTEKYLYVLANTYLEDYFAHRESVEDLKTILRPIRLLKYPLNHP
jgi:hypothetical protein